MAIAPLQPHSSWYRRFWYEKRSPLNTLVDRALIFGVVVLLLLAATSSLLDRSSKPSPIGTAPLAQAERG